MRKCCWIVVVAFSGLVLSGCCPLQEELRRTNTSLRSQLQLSEETLDALRAENASLTAELGEAGRKRDEALQEAERMEGVAASLQEARDQLEAQRRELQKLVEGLSGISVETRDEGNFLVLETDIFFDLGKTDLSEPAMSSLDTLAQYLADHPDITVRIDGHTDGVPIRHAPFKDNYHLAAMRAHSVMAYLMERGLAPSRAYIVGFGPNRPVVEPPEPEQPVAENRRVEILVVPAGSRTVTDILAGFGD
jgi:chemotaxis protein MotB